jgi:hypothetical protein
MTYTDGKANYKISDSKCKMIVSNDTIKLSNDISTQIASCIETIRYSERLLSSSIKTECKYVISIQTRDIIKGL